MFEQQPRFSREKVALFASEAIAQDNPAGWFEPLYAEANGDTSLIPWSKNKAHPYLTDWLITNKIQGNNQSALVIGCGLGDDAEALAKVGYQVTAFDISATAIAWCQQRFPDSQVNYVVGDLLLTLIQAIAVQYGWRFLIHRLLARWQHIHAATPARPSPQAFC